MSTLTLEELVSELGAANGGSFKAAFKHVQSAQSDLVERARAELARAPEFTKDELINFVDGDMTEQIRITASKNIHAVNEVMNQIFNLEEE